MLKIHQATYSNLENNKGKLDLRHIEKIATIYEMDVLDILKEDELTFYNKKNKRGNNYLVINQISDKLIEQYEERINELKQVIVDFKENR